MPLFPTKYTIDSRKFQGEVPFNGALPLNPFIKKKEKLLKLPMKLKLKLKLHLYLRVAL